MGFFLVEAVAVDMKGNQLFTDSSVSYDKIRLMTSINHIPDPATLFSLVLQNQ
jgi:hypothetical protein